MATKVLNFSKRFKFSWLLRANTGIAQRSTKQRSKPVSGNVCVSLAVFPVVSAWSFRVGKKEETTNLVPPKVEDPEQLIAQEADSIYDEGDVEKLYQYLTQYKSSNNAEILWRLCRALRNKAEATTDAKQRKELMYEAYEYVKKALAIDENNSAVHKWFAIMLKKISEFEGTKQLISNSYKVKEHFMKAIELNPSDATSIHLLGVWCFTVADLPWYERTIASAIFATPPSSSYEEALKYFIEAEKVDPNFYGANLLMLGKTYLRMKQNDLAVLYLQRAKDYAVKSADDKQAHDEAVQLLKSMGQQV